MSGIEWGVAGILTAHVKRGEMHFSAIANPLLGKWQVLGLITPLIDPDATEQEQTEQTLATHSHQLIGIYAKFDKARRAMAAFLLECPMPETACPCEPVMPRCELPPAGWRCSRRKGHQGPCAPHPILPGAAAADRATRLAALQGKDVDRAVRTRTCPLDGQPLQHDPERCVLRCSCSFEVGV